VCQTKRRNDEFCEPRRTGAHLAEGAVKDTGYVHATVLPAHVASSTTFHRSQCKACAGIHVCLRIPNINFLCSRTKQRLLSLVHADMLVRMGCSALVCTRASQHVGACILLFCDMQRTLGTD